MFLTPSLTMNNAEVIISKKGVIPKKIIDKDNKDKTVDNCVAFTAALTNDKISQQQQSQVGRRVWQSLNQLVRSIAPLKY